MSSICLKYFVDGVLMRALLLLDISRLAVIATPHTLLCTFYNKWEMAAVRWWGVRLSVSDMTMKNLIGTLREIEWLVGVFFLFSLFSIHRLILIVKLRARGGLMKAKMYQPFELGLMADAQELLAASEHNCRIEKWRNEKKIIWFKWLEREREFSVRAMRRQSEIISNRYTLRHRLHPFSLFSSSFIMH